MKRMIAIWLLAASLVGVADTAADKCDNALHYCQDLVGEQDQAIQHLKDGTKQLENKLAQDDEPLIPWYGYAIIGLGLGLLGGYEVGSHIK